MKIAQICQFFYPEITGVTTHILNLSKYLLDLGHSVEIFTPKRGDSQLEEVVEGIPIHRIPSPVYPRMFDRIRRQQFDVVHSHSIWQHTPVALLSAKLSGAQFVLTTHGTWFHVAKDKLRLKLYFSTVWKYTLQGSSAVIIVNGDERPMLESQGVEGRKIHYIPNAVDTEIFRPVEGSSHDPAFILFVGRIQEAKGVFIFLEAAARIISEFPAAKFVLVGDGEDLPAARAFVAAHGLNHSVEFAGSIDNSKLPGYYSKAGVFVLPSEYENCAGVYLEAMACETPVIGTAVGGTPYIIRDGIDGYLVERGSVEQIVQGLSSLLSDPGLAERMGKAGRQRVLAQFSWRSVASEIESLYLSVCKNRELYGD